MSIEDRTRNKYEAEEATDDATYISVIHQALAHLDLESLSDLIWMEIVAYSSLHSITIMDVLNQVFPPLEKQTKMQKILGVKRSSS